MRRWSTRGASRTLRARHRLLAELAAELAGDEELRGAHRRLLATSVRPGERSRHLLALGDRAGAYAEAVRAAGQATTPGERLAHLLLASECAPPDELGDLLLRTATAANDAGEPARAQRLLDRLPGTGAAGCAALVQRGRACFELGDVTGWRDSVAAGLAAARTPAEQVYFAGEQAAVAYFVDDDPARAAELAGAAVARARAEHVAHGSALRMLGAAQYMLGDRAWRTTLTDAVAQGRREHDRAGTFAGLNNLITVHESAGDPAEGMQLADAAAAEAAELRLGFWERHFRTRRLSLALHAGDHELVDRLGRELLDQPLLPRSREEVTHALVVSLADRGRVAEALTLAETILTSPGVRPSDYHSARTIAFHTARRWRAVLAEREPFLAAGPVPSVRTLLAPLFAWAAHRLGRPPQGEEQQLVEWGLLAGVGPELAGIRAAARRAVPARRGPLRPGGGRLPSLPPPRRRAVRAGGCRGVTARRTERGRRAPAGAAAARRRRPRSRPRAGRDRPAALGPADPRPRPAPRAAQRA